MAFYDKNGVELAIGDHIIPDEGREICLTHSAYMDEFGQEVLFGYQVAYPAAFSILTQENLSSQWAKI